MTLPATSVKRITKAPDAAPEPPVTHVERGADWRETLDETARAASSRLTVRERSRNPLIPDNFLDLSEAGFPAGLTVLGVQIPRPGVPAEMAQYREMVNLQWLHVPWSVISSNGGEDGKAHVPGATPYDLGGGEPVAVLAGNYLMYANREQYLERRVRNARKADESLQAKVETREEETRELEGKRIGTRVESNDPGPLTIDELMAYEQRIGDEPSVKGLRIER